MARNASDVVVVVVVVVENEATRTYTHTRTHTHEHARAIHMSCTIVVSVLLEALLGHVADAQGGARRFMTTRMCLMTLAPTLLEARLGRSWIANSSLFSSKSPQEASEGPPIDSQESPKTRQRRPPATPRTSQEAPRKHTDVQRRFRKYEKTGVPQAHVKPT